MENQVAPVSFVDDPKAPEFFASDAMGYFLADGNLSITFASNRVNHVGQPGPINRVVMARVVMPVAAAQRLALSLYDFLKQRGLDPMPAPANKEQIQ